MRHCLVAFMVSVAVTGVEAWSQTAVPPPPWAATVKPDSYLLAAADVPGWTPTTDGAGDTRIYTVGDQGAVDRTSFALVRSQALTAGGKTVALKVSVFESPAASAAYCAGVEVWGLDQAGNPAPNTTWHERQNDVGSPLLAGNGGAAFSDPRTLMLRYRRTFARLDDTGAEAAGSDAMKAMALAWLGRVSALPDGDGTAVVANAPTAVATVVAPPTVVVATAIAPPSQDAIVVLQPSEGSTVGPSIEVVGKTGPNQLVVSYILAFRVDTGEQVRNVPGFRGKSKETGDFACRVATPRISFGDQKVQVRYELHVYVSRPDGTKGPETVVNLAAPPP